MIRPEFLQTIFIVKKPPENFWEGEFAVITACNPLTSGGRDSDAVETAKLRKLFSRRGLKKHRVMGASPDWSHQEPGFAVLGLALEEALEIGREFRQDAIFWVGGDGRIDVLSCVDGERCEVGLWSERIRTWADKPGYRIYVVRLDSGVMNSKRFRAANPTARREAECLYVGMTACTPEKRFAQHKRGYKACPFVRKHGIALAPELFPTSDLLPHAEAEKLEVSHAENLRARGFAVWQR
jgi:hypothetical protein